MPYFEIELALVAFLQRTRDRVAFGARIAQYSCTELHVDDDGGILLRQAGGDGRPEAVVN